MHCMIGSFISVMTNSWIDCQKPVTQFCDKIRYNAISCCCIYILFNYILYHCWYLCTYPSSSKPNLKSHQHCDCHQSETKPEK